jgi:hypothetical protein
MISIENIQESLLAGEQKERIAGMLEELLAKIE